jgi:hypothetical protein
MGVAILEEAEIGEGERVARVVGEEGEAQVRGDGGGVEAEGVVEVGGGEGASLRGEEQVGQVDGGVEVVRIVVQALLKRFDCLASLAKEAVDPANLKQHVRLPTFLLERSLQQPHRLEIPPLPY